MRPVLLALTLLSSDADLRVLAPGFAFETTAAVSRADARNAVVGAISTGPSRRAVDVYTTHDGGLTWSGAPLPLKGDNGRDYAGQGDPVVVADRLGVFHFTALMRTASNSHTAITAMRSTDGGRTWSTPHVLAELSPNASPRLFDDKQWIAVDDTGGPNDGNVYLLWQRISFATTPPQSRMMFARSIDRGVTWSAPVAITEPSVSGQSPSILSAPVTRDALFPSGAIDPTTGELVVAWIDRRDDPQNTLARLYATRSHDGGLTFDTPVPFSPPFSIDADWIGDYYGVAAHDGHWLATFSDGSGRMSSVRLRFTPAPPPRKGRVVR